MKKPKHIETLFVVLLLGAFDAAFADTSTFGEDDRYAWGANVGWVNFRSDQPSVGDGVAVYDHFLGGYAWAPNLGWVNFGDGSPTNRVAYVNTDETDFGVNHDGAGNLSGFAWAQNVGWINFGWATNGDPNRPRFNVQDGVFSGFAWAANVGWITLESGWLRTESVTVVDSDGDGIADAWELEHAPTLKVLEAYPSDEDLDGISDYEEYICDTDPIVPGGGVIMTRIGSLIGLNAGVITWSSSPARIYTAEYSTNVLTAPWLNGGTYAGSPSNSTSQAYVASLSNLYFRVWAKLPLTP